MSDPNPVVPRSPVPDAAGPVLTHLEPGEAPAVVRVDWTGAVHQAGPAAATLLGGPVEPDWSLYTALPPGEQVVLHELLQVAASDADAEPEAVLVGRRLDGLPLVVRITAPSGGRQVPVGSVDDHVELVLQRWGGPVRGPGDPPLAAPVRSGPDHLLSHDARGAVRNTRNFGRIFSRKVLDDAGAPVPGADGTPLPVEMLDTALRAAATADEMLDRIVWFVRLESDPITMGPLVLGDLLDQARATAATTLDELAGAAGMGELAEPVPVDLDPANATAVVTGDRDLLVWALAELLVNARKFGGPDVRVAVAAAPTAHWVTVRVTSVGAVVDPALAEDAFRLGRLLQPRGERPGIGMGLPLCRRIVTRHGGRVVARSEAGVGTTIELLLLGSGPSDVG